MLAVSPLGEYGDGRSAVETGRRGVGAGLAPGGRTAKTSPRPPTEAQRGLPLCQGPQEPTELLLEGRDHALALHWTTGLSGPQLA